MNETPLTPLTHLAPVDYVVMAVYFATVLGVGCRRAAAGRG